MILLIGIEKGGTGKSTVATNLAVMRSQEKHDLLLVDADKQMTASYWAARRAENNEENRIICVQKQGNKIHRDILDLSEKFDDILIDAGGQDSQELRASMVIADVLCLPFQASQPDIWTLETMEKLIDQAQSLNPNLRVEVVINRAATNPQISEVQEARECLKDYPNLTFHDIVIRERRAFRKAMMLGQAVTELQPSDEKAISEMTSLYNQIYHYGKH